MFVLHILRTALRNQKREYRLKRNGGIVGYCTFHFHIPVRRESNEPQLNRKNTETFRGGNSSRDISMHMTVHTPRTVWISHRCNISQSRCTDKRGDKKFAASAL